MMSKRSKGGFLAALALGALLASAAAGDDIKPGARAGQAASKTAKERLTGKAADEQRVNDCKLPPEKRGSKKRPADSGPRAAAKAGT